MPELDPYKEQFSPQPEDVGRGNFIPPGYWVKLTNALLQTMAETSSETASYKDKLFLDRTAELSSMCARHIIGLSFEAHRRNRAIPYPEEDGMFIGKIAELRESILKVREVGEKMPALEGFTAEEVAAEPFILMSVLENGIGGLNFSVREKPGLWDALKTYAIGVTSLLQLIGEYKEGIEVDDYLEQKLQELINLYNNVTSKN